MKGAFLISGDPRLFDKAKDALVARGGKYSPEVGAVQVRGVQGTLFTLYSTAEPEWEFREGPFFAAPGVKIPEISKMNGYAVECSSECQFVEIVRELVSVTEETIWVLDGDGVVWLAQDVDVARVRL